MISSAYLIISFILSIIFLEKEYRDNPLSFVGTAMSSMNMFERLFFYMIPVTRDMYLIILVIQYLKPEWMKHVEL